MRYKLKHLTTYHYDHPVDNYHGVFCLQPLNLKNQFCHSFQLLVNPVPATITSRTDYFGNTKHYFSLHEAHKRLDVTSISEVEVIPLHPVMINTISYNDARDLFQRDSALRIELLQFILPSRFTQWNEDVISFAQSCFPADVTLYEGAKSLCHKIFTEFEFKAGFSTINTPIETILRERKGVCQDFTHVAIACLRSLGLAAKYVSGYLETKPPPGKEKLQGSDASHAWLAVYVPDMGWVEFDPTNDLTPTDRHIRTGFGRDYSDITPVKGIYFGAGQQKIKVEVDVIPY